MRWFKSIVDWMNANDGVAGWMGGIVAIGTAFVAFAVWVNKRAWFRHPAAVGAFRSWLVWASAGLTLAVFAFMYRGTGNERTESADFAVVPVHPEVDDDMFEGDVHHEDFHVSGDGTIHVSFNPIAGYGNVTHKNQPSSIFEEWSVAPGHVRCIECGAVGILHQSNGDCQFIEAKLNPAPPAPPDWLVRHAQRIASLNNQVWD